ncbi:SecY-interacting protein [Aestuariibacter sp. AA17]|uniref:Protein Syd n=1 Tax=Fluctibacter corallii TaxID=2984329 RepID=A0ABT3A3S3_9ALTE|nr:SecY-interacting protein [Aestuariibacter sp. AA17]MCV2883262.1 SecY-interacting protein [Aestuariibacter sp. AA17]
MQTIDDALADFIQRYFQTAKTEDHALRIEFDSQWQSACYLQVGDDGDWVEWQPVKRDVPGDFSGVESALEMTLNAQFKAYFGTYWSDNFNAKTSRGSLQLLMPWNNDDFIRLQQNLVGHVLMKRRLKQAETLFFAVTDEEDFIITVDNASGAVMLEQVGMLPKEKLADDLASFIKQLEPDFT